MGHTITRAASGESVFTAPKDSQSQAKGQKNDALINVPSLFL